MKSSLNIVEFTLTLKENRFGLIPKLILNLLSINHTQIFSKSLFNTFRFPQRFYVGT